jgi:eukaryotic-like serine/threonine-protein kinase
MAEVFAGYVKGLHGFQKPVALKRLLPELACDAELVERLIAEAKLLVGIQHGNIVGVLDLARDHADVFLVMEFVDGPSLRQLLAARGERRLPFGVATYIAQSAATGLEFAHARPGGAIIHADISPSNLLLTTSGEVRVADFGIARREGHHSGIVEGKWAYMAPEQARGEPLTPASDVFALGVVLYEMITGARPFGVPQTLEERCIPVAVVPPSAFDRDIPPGLEAICMRALADDPRDRFPRMQQLHDALVDERFRNHWRDGANELAYAIRDVPAAHHPAAKPQPTIITDRPVTLMTRSLIIPPLPADLESSDAYTVIAPRPSQPPYRPSFHAPPAPAPAPLPAAPPPPVMPESYGGRAQWTDAKRKPARLFAAVPDHEHGTLWRRSMSWAAIEPQRLRYLALLFACSLLVGMLAAVVKFACTD